jgi:hypothetical protein
MSAAPQLPRLLTPADIGRNYADTAALLGLHTVTVKRYVRRGWLQIRRVGGRTYVTTESINELLLHGTPSE